MSVNYTAPGVEVPPPLPIACSHTSASRDQFARALVLRVATGPEACSPRSQRRRAASGAIVRDRALYTSPQRATRAAQRTVTCTDGIIGCSRSLTQRH